MKRALSNSLPKDKKRVRIYDDDMEDEEITFNFERDTTENKEEREPDTEPEPDYDVEIEDDDEDEDTDTEDNLNDNEKMAKSFIRGRNEWTALISKFIDKHVDKCNLNILFDWKVLSSESASQTSIISSYLKQNNVLYDNSKCVVLSSLLNVVGKQKDTNHVDIYKSLIGEVCDNSINQYKNNCIIKASYVEPISDKKFYENIDNSLDIESQIYKYAVREIIKYTPCILNSYGSYICDVDNINNLSEVMKNAKKEKQDDGTYIYSDIKGNGSTKINLLILEKSSGKSISQYLKQKNKDRTALLTILFQLFWTLYVMSRLNVKHNDLHFGNIFVDELQEEITLYFKLPSDAPQNYKDKYVNMKTKYLLRIYDFDRGSTIGYPDIDRNIALDTYYCDRYGECNDMFEIYDLWTACTYLSLIDYDNDYDEYKKGGGVKDRKLQDDDIINQFEFVKGEIEELLKIKKLKDWGIYEKKRSFNHLFPKTDIPLKERINKDIKEILLNKLYDIIDISDFEIEDTVKRGVVCFSLPPQKQLVYYNPRCVYDDYKRMDFSGVIDTGRGRRNVVVDKDKNKRKHMENLNVYIETSLNSSKYFLWFLTNNDSEYNLKEKALELLTKYLEKRNPEFLESTKIESNCVSACIYLSSPWYHKVLSNHSIYKDNINISFHVFIGSKIKPYIDDVWTTFDGTLPIEVPQL